MTLISSRDRAGIVLIDAMIYIAVIGLILAIAASVFTKGMRESAGLQRNVADIERALKAGERWRADVRLATRAIEADETTLTIPQQNGEVIYEFTTNQIWRIASARREVFLARVQQSSMTPERRGDVTGWKWELELERRLKEARVRPMFTFMAAPGGSQ